MSRDDLHPTAIALTVATVLAAVIACTLAILARLDHAKPSEPEWVDVGRGIYQTCTDTGRSILKGDDGSLVLDRDDTECEAAG